MNTHLQEKLKGLPKSPGVYLHKSRTGEVIYVGKAAILRNRVRHYFQSGKDNDAKTQALVEEIFDTDWIETESELDALFLESELVKRYMPRYNVLLRDDKSQTFVRIDMRSEWPTVSFTRNPADDKAEYFGPYYNGFAIKKALRYLRRIFPYYTKPPKGGGRPDLDAHIGLSPRPETTSEEYKSSLRQLILYIKGGRKKIVREVEEAMRRAAREEHFEEAAIYRNRLRDLQALQQRIMFGDREFLDISKDQALSDLQFLLGLTKAPVRIEGYDISHLSGTNVVASMVVFTNGVSDRAQYRKFKMTRQQNDDYANMYEVIYRRFSEKNCKSWGVPDVVFVDGGQGQLQSAIRAMSDRGITSIPVLGVAKRQEELVVHRELSHVQTNVVLEYAKGVRRDEGVSVQEKGEYFIVNLHAGRENASDHSRNLRGSMYRAPARYEHVVKLIQRVRDESHRFAVSYHSVLRAAKQTEGALDAIQGVGPVTRKQLLKAFGSAKGVSRASKEELSRVIGQKRAELVYSGYHDTTTPSPEPLSD